jgi:hypothetical protein
MDDIVVWTRDNIPAKTPPQLRPHSFPDPSCGRMKELRQDETNAQKNASSCRILCLKFCIRILFIKGSDFIQETPQKIASGNFL